MLAKERTDHSFSFILVAAVLVNNQLWCIFFMVFMQCILFCCVFQDSETEAAYQTFSQTEGESSAAEVNSKIFLWVVSGRMFYIVIFIPYPLYQFDRSYN